MLRSQNIGRSGGNLNNSTSISPTASTTSLDLDVSRTCPQTRVDSRDVQSEKIDTILDTTLTEEFREQNMLMNYRKAFIDSQSENKKLRALVDQLRKEVSNLKSQIEEKDAAIYDMSQVLIECANLDPKDL